MQGRGTDGCQSRAEELGGLGPQETPLLAPVATYQGRNNAGTGRFIKDGDRVEVTPKGLMFPCTQGTAATKFRKPQLPGTCLSPGLGVGWGSG